jgi:hypothetical protein
VEGKAPLESGVVDDCSGAAAARAAIPAAVRARGVDRLGDVEDDAARAPRPEEAARELEALEVVATVDVEGADAADSRVVLDLHMLVRDERHATRRDRAGEA